MRTFASFILRVTRELPKSRSCFKTRQHFQLITPQKHMIRRTYSTTKSIISKPTGASGASFEVDVRSRDMIKPSSPTPSHLKTLQFSILDQLTYSIYTPMVFFFQNDPHFLDNDPLKRTTLLKKSLCETLVDFYPLAGRTEDRESIHCNDEGVEFCEARVDQRLAKVIEDPNLDELQALLPFQVIPRHKNIVLSVQVNHFSCGGMAIGLCIAHKIADGLSTCYFLKSWANKAFKNIDIPRPTFDAASVCPPLEDLSRMVTADDTQQSGAIKKVAAKRLIFDKNKLDELKATAETIGNLNPTKLELVSAFIWNKLVEAAATDASFSNISTALHTVNLRPRMEPPIQETCFGNFVWLARTPPMSGIEQSTTQIVMLNHLRKSFNKIDHNYVKQLLCRERDVDQLRKELDYLFENGDQCIKFTSLHRSSLYVHNFGMGEPIWACITTSPVKDMVCLFGTMCGKGIEAWIHMSETDIAILDRHLPHCSN